MDTRVAIYSPPDPNAVANLDAVGAVDLDSDNWTLEGYDWIGFDIQGSTTSRNGGQAGDLQTIEITMWTRSDLSLSHRLKVLNGPWIDRYLYVQSIGFTDARSRTFAVICRLTTQ